MNELPKKIYLLGFMGSGKSTLGRELAKQLNFSFNDLDDMIEEYCQCTIADLFTNLGEDHFRLIETKILKHTQNLEHAVISLGGGTPCFNDNMDFVNQNGKSIYLQIKPEVLVERLINEKAKRPLISQAQNKIDLEKLISTKLSARSQFYEEAHHIVDGNASIDKIIEEINSLINF
ncbi:shikimate kinase [Portibacter lacus]|uniref:Shikimate kinase n=1 Tax=Portibacter lacus TaxID=1099794 RepID=A0AA37SL59_9BACT|nr:shikimate kinase [Portibacter lacus]GLR16493.1 shikimate kinase [Portibacter lacus]